MSEHVFISYARSDSEYARAFANEFDSLGIEAWTDRRMSLADNWADSIRDAITAASWFVVLVSDRSLASDWISFELGAAIGQGKRVIPVYLSDSAKRRAPAPFKQFQGIAVEGYSPSEAARKVARAIMPRHGELRSSKRAS